MTDHHTAYIVTLDRPMREDDVQATIAALGQIKGVIDVRPVVAGIGEMPAAIRMQHAWQTALLGLIERGVQP